MSEERWPNVNWNAVVQPIIQAKQVEDRQKQANASEFQRQFMEERAEALARTNEYQDRQKQAVINRWRLLEALHAKQLLQGLNSSKDIWRGLGAINSQEYTHYDVTSVEHSLEVSYAGYSSGWAPEPNEFGTNSWQSFPTTITTRTTIGITPVKILGIEEKNGQHIILQNVDKFLKGSEFFEGEVLYVLDSDVGLIPVEGADTFQEGNTSLSSSDFGHGVFLISAEHPQAKEILVEVLKRSCIRRAASKRLPLQLVEHQRVDKPKSTPRRGRGFLRF